MAILTENDRRSASTHPVPVVYPIPDGLISSQDRTHVAWIFRDTIINKDVDSDNVVIGFGGTSFFALGKFEI